MKATLIWMILVAIVSAVSYRLLHIQAKERWRRTLWI